MPNALNRGGVDERSAISLDTLVRMEDHFRAVGLPELSMRLRAPRMTRREALLGGVVLLLDGAFLASYYLDSVPRFVWPLALAIAALVRVSRTDLQRGYQERLSSAGLLALMLLAAVSLGLVVHYAGGTVHQYLPFVYLQAIEYGTLLTSYGLTPTRLVASLWRGALAARRVAAAIPAMVAVVLFVFITGDAWKLFGRMDAVRLIVGLALVAVVVLALLRVRLATVITRVLEPSRHALASIPAGTPAEAYLRRSLEVPESIPVVPTPARRNVANTIVLLAFVRLLGAALILWALLVLLGVVLVSPEQTGVYVGGASTATVAHVSIAGRQFVLTGALLSVAAWLAALSALVYATVDDGVAAAVAGEEVTKLSSVIAAWVYYKLGCDRYLHASPPDPEPQRSHGSPGVDDDSLGDANDLGVRLYDEGRFDEAEALWLRALDAKTEGLRGLAAFNLGLLYDAAGRMPQAISYYEVAAALGETKALNNLAFIRYHAGDTSAALRYLESAAATAQTAEEQRLAMRDLRLVREGRVWKK